MQNNDFFFKFITELQIHPTDRIFKIYPIHITLANLQALIKFRYFKNLLYFVKVQHKDSKKVL